MTELAALEAQKKTISDAIAALSGDLDRHALSRALPTASTTRLASLRRQLATVNMKLKQAAKTAG